MSNGTVTPTPAATTTHVLGVVLGVVAGAAIAGPLLAVAAPAVGLGALVSVVPGVAGIVGGYLGHLWTKPA